MPSSTTPFKTDSHRWNALTTRNPSADSHFVYCVLSTSIYCRPSCPARLCRRANVVYHDTPVAAEAAGFRACRRCRPELGLSFVDPQKAMVERACTIVRNAGRKGRIAMSVRGLAKEVGVSESHFCRAFKKWKGVTPGEFITSVVRGREREVNGNKEMQEEKVAGALGTGELASGMDEVLAVDLDDIDLEMGSVDLAATVFDEAMLDELLGPLPGVQTIALPPPSPGGAMKDLDPIDEFLNIPP